MPVLTRFDSVAFKEPKFEIDGVFLPGMIYFCDLQFEKDDRPTNENFNHYTTTTLPIISPLYPNNL
jgi:predicted transposase YdaD